MVESKRSEIFSIAEDARQHYSDYQNFLARFVERDQLLNEHLWERFVAQFVEKIDGTNMGWRGEYFGKMLRGGCLTYRYTRSKKLYIALTKAVNAMMQVQEESGRISSYSTETEFHAWDMWCRKYVMLGMEYYYEICASGITKERILCCISRQADYIMAHIGPEEGKIGIAECSRECWGGMNSCSILEPFVRLYKLTGKEKYLRFAEYIISTGFCVNGNLIELASLGVPPYQFPQVKAYEMMSCFEGLIEYAALMGREDYLQIAVKLAKMIHQTDVTVIGSCGCTHELFDNSVEKQTQYSDMIMLETCVTVTWMKLCYRLLQMTGDSYFADWIEQAALNAMAGAVNDFENKKNQALTFDSYSPLVTNSRARVTGGRQMIGENEYYGCCACIGSAGTAISNLYGFLYAKDGIVISHYQRGTVHFTTPSKQRAKLRIISSLPARKQVKICLSIPKSETFTIHLRIPAWSKDTVIHVNNEENKQAPSGQYYELERHYKNGDCIVINLDVTARGEVRDGKLAVTKAGYVLARDLRHGDDYGEAITYILGRNCKVVIKRTVPTIRAKMQYKMRLTGGKEIFLVDYASAGKNWDDPESGAHVWMDLRPPLS